MNVDLPYGKTRVEVKVPDGTTVAYPRVLSRVADVGAEIRRAMAEPIGSPPLRELAAGKRDAVVVINDITRPAPSREMLAAILEELQLAGIPETAVTVVIATGNHRPNSPDEIARMIGEGFARSLRVINHACEDNGALTAIAAPGLDVPVRINSHVARASVRILTGLIAPHQAAGYSGGRKSLAPGVAALETIAKQHSFPIRPYDPAMAWMKGNPFHEVAVRVARAVGIDFIVNVVKNCRGEVVHVVAGDLEAAHEAGVDVCEQSWVVTLPQKYDVVIVTPGGFPRDIDLHQAQKAMATAELVAAKEGVIVLLAECADGIGKFAGWMKEAASAQAIIERFSREGFTREHSSKAFMCARALVKHPVVVCCTGIPRAEMEAMFFRHADTAQEAVDTALEMKVGRGSVLVLPYAVDCVPRVNPL
ncbi:MAG TPA: nickel-dependent lactate racemase [Candidatus Methylomirabilis sp.]|nr:nickel-dependent lactate racemase [Candidatus Methylomirabilis sp.]